MIVSSRLPWWALGSISWYDSRWTHSAAAWIHGKAGTGAGRALIWIVGGRVDERAGRRTSATEDATTPWRHCSPWPVFHDELAKISLPTRYVRLKIIPQSYKGFEPGNEKRDGQNTSVLPGNVSGAVRTIFKAARNNVATEHARMLMSCFLLSKTLLRRLFIHIWSPRSC